jgi:hypothetical protein
VIERICISALVTLLASCASQVRRDEPALPFHVALVPIQCATPADARATGGANAASDAGSAQSASDGGAEHDGLKLAIDAAALSERLRATLESTCFARVTLLAPPDGSTAEEFAHWSPEKRNAYWIAASASAGADLILESELRAAPELHGKMNEKFWLNLPLFLLGGPFCYFIGDNTYVGDARLDAWLYDLRPIAASQATLADGRSELTHVQARFRGTDLDFIDRAGSSVGWYAASLVVPAGLLSRNNASVERCVADTAISELAQGLMRELRGESEHVLAGEHVTSFHVAPESTVTCENGVLRFHGAVLLRTGEIQRMDAWRLEAGDHWIEGEFHDAVADAELTTARNRYLRYALDIRLPSACGAKEVKLTLAGGGRDVSVRTFTFEVGASSDVQPVPVQAP